MTSKCDKGTKVWYVTNDVTKGGERSEVTLGVTSLRISVTSLTICVTSFNKTWQFFATIYTNVTLSRPALLPPFECHMFFEYSNKKELPFWTNFDSLLFRTKISKIWEASTWAQTFKILSTKCFLFAQAYTKRVMNLD